MPSNLIFFVVFATVMQGVFVPSSAVSGELSDEALVILDQIKSYEREVIFLKKKAAGYIFDTLKDLTTQIIHDTTNTDQDFSAVVKEAISSAKQSIDHTVDPISLVSGESCAAIEPARNASYADFEKIFYAIGGAIQSAKDGGYPESRAVINNYETESRNGFASLTATIYNTMRSCLNTDFRADFEAVIQKAQDGTRTNFNNIIDAAYAAIKIWAAYASDKNLYEGNYVLVFIESRRLDVWQGILRHEESYFGLLDAFYIDAHLGKTKIVDDLFLIRSNLKYSSNTFEESLEIVFATLVVSLEEKTFVVEVDDANYYPVANATLARANLILQRGTVLIYDTVLATQPTSAAKVAAAKLVSPLPTAIVISAYFTGIALARNDGLLCPATPAEILVIKDAQDAASVVVIAELTNVVSANNPRTLVEHIPKVASIQASGTSHVFDANKNIYDAITLASNLICRKKGATQDDYVEIRAYQKISESAAVRAVEDVYYMDLIEFLAAAGY